MRLAGWAKAAATLALCMAGLGGAAAAPVSDAVKYAQNVQYEVDYQNFSCSELQDLDAFLNELRRCGPPNAMADPADPTAGISLPTSPSQSAADYGQDPFGQAMAGSNSGPPGMSPALAARALAASRIGDPVVTSDGSRVCVVCTIAGDCHPSGPPTYKLTHQLYDAMGPTLKQAMTTIGVTREMDYRNPLMGNYPPEAMPMAASRALIADVQGRIETAQVLKNCRR